MIKLARVDRRYRSGDIETKALRGIDLEIDDGEFLAIMGPSGCGKSTLLSILGTLDRPTGGTYLFQNVDVASLGDRALTQLRRRHIGFIFQNFNLIDELTIRENIALSLVYRRTAAAERREAIDWAMDQVGIAHRTNHFPSQLSGGQQQRAAIARAIVSRPDLILADEPTGNLDTENGAQVMTLLRQFNAAGTTVVMVTHSPGHADWAQRRITMLDGCILGEASDLRVAAE